MKKGDSKPLCPFFFADKICNNNKENE